MTRPDAPPIRRALLSVSDKTGLVNLAQALAAHGIELVSTGGTAEALRTAGLAVTDVAAVTGLAEMLDGRVKTLHPAIHGGLLADLHNPAHRDALEKAEIAPIGLVVCNLYPFEAAVAAGHDPQKMVETIDVGGPTMTRAAAKNFGSVGIVTDPDDYGVIIAAVEANGGQLPYPLRRRLAAKAFARLAAYDAAIASWLEGQTAQDDVAVDHTLWRAIGGKRISLMRYGENPHQAASFYQDAAGGGLAGAKVVQGKALSYNNVADADAAWTAVAGFPDRPAVVIVKHANPCGIAVADELVGAYEAARRCDPVSAFGGVVALSQRLDLRAAEAISKIFTEVVIAPSADDDALERLAQKPSVRVLLAGTLPALSALSIKSTTGGFLVQSGDGGALAPGAGKVVSARQPTEAEWQDLRFAWASVKPVKSNAIVFAKSDATVGIGAGQMSRVDAARIAAWKAAEAAREAGEPQTRTIGAVAASDAFFPFADGLEVIAEAGATAVIQPGASKRDDEVIEAANRHGMAMVFTGMRHFRH
ncbi:MAG: bifunctional phosphoribosylaminoimidazolecarboxamide formyltransferase/IMP cyclohydrolase [Pseudomonadota bacterium]